MSPTTIATLVVNGVTLVGLVILAVIMIRERG